jgi:hypothetical protein
MFLTFTIVVEILFPIVLVAFNHGMTLGKYGEEAIFELLMAAFLIFILFLSGNSYVFSEKKVGFFNSLILCLPMLLFSFYISVISIPDMLNNFNLANFISLVFLCMFVGIAEEFLCRAWLQNEFIERFGSTKKGVLISILLSSLVFGFMHITNGLFTTQGFLETALQIFQALASGFLFGAIYYKTKNIWSVAFLHGFFDFALMLSEVNLLKDCISTYPNAGSIIFSVVISIFIMLFYVFGGVFALSSNIGVKYFKNSKTPKMVSIIGVIVSIILFYGTSVTQTIITEGETGTICYEYEHTKIYEDYDVVTTTKTDFTFVIDDIKYELYKDSDEIIIKNEDQEIGVNYAGTLKKYVLIDNKETIDVLLEYYDNESVIYHMRLVKKDFTDLDSIKDKFKKIDVPEIQSIGYVLFDGDDLKYPYMRTTIGSELFIDGDNELYVIDKNKD